MTTRRGARALILLASIAACADAPAVAVAPPEPASAISEVPAPAVARPVAPTPVAVPEVARVERLPVAQVTDFAAEPTRLPRTIRAETWAPPDVQAGARTFHAVSFDGHVHSAHSRDAQHPTRSVLAIAARADLDAIVLTDHGTTLGVSELIAEARGVPVPVLSGAEVGGTFGHAVVWGFDAYTLLHDAPHQDLDVVASLVKPRGAVLVLAHPGWWIRGNAVNPRLFMQYDSLRPGGRGQAIDALELWNGTYPVMSARLVAEWAVLLERGLFVPVVGNSDFHEVGGQILGTPRNVALCPGVREAHRETVFTCLLEATRAGRLYVSDGPTIAMTLGEATFGETVMARPGESLDLAVRAESALGGTLVVYRGLETVASVRLTPAVAHEQRFAIMVPANDTFVRVEIVRPQRIPLTAPFSLLTNPILVDVAPARTTQRGTPLSGPQTGWPGRGFVRRGR